MKYLNKLFAFNDSDDQPSASLSNKSSSKLTSTLYSVIFEPDEQTKEVSPERSTCFSSLPLEQESRTDDRDTCNSLRLIPNCREQKQLNKNSHQPELRICRLSRGSLSEASVRFKNHRHWRRETSSLFGPEHFGDDCLPVIGSRGFECQTDQESEDTEQSKINTSSCANNPNIGHRLGAHLDTIQTLCDTSQLIEDDWILLEDPRESSRPTRDEINQEYKDTTERAHKSQLIQRRYSSHKLHHLSEYQFFDANLIQELKQMALDSTDLDLIKASWVPVRRDLHAAGVLLFKGLFTKFPQYLKFFPQFSDLDLERMHENKRLAKHSNKVLETVGFVVDSIGDESKTNQLSEALTNLVKGHLKRKIGLKEFRNLGIVLIDFICEVNNKRDFGSSVNSASGDCGQNNESNNSSTSTTSRLACRDSEELDTMTSALDKIRASSSPSSSEEDSYLMSSIEREVANNSDQSVDGRSRRQSNEGTGQGIDTCSGGKPADRSVNTNGLVAAWTKLYGSILELVKREEAQQ